MLDMSDLYWLTEVQNGSAGALFSQEPRQAA